MTMDAPAPLTPADCDLRAYPHMRIDLTRLRRSKTWLRAKRNPALGFYAFNLWAASWHELPAASLEHDDDVLADLAMCDPARWAEVRDDVLAGWILCSDGRLYHPVVAEKAREAWASRRSRSDAGRLGNAARWSGRKPASDIHGDHDASAERSQCDDEAIAPQSECIASESHKRRDNKRKKEPSFIFVPDRPSEPSTRQTPAAEPDGFADFWEAFPRRQGKAEARRAYANALKHGATASEIVEGARRYRPPLDAQFTPMPTTWLHQGRWADEPFQPAASSTPRPTGPTTFTHGGTTITLDDMAEAL